MTCGSGSSKAELSEEQKQILEALAGSEVPCGSKDIAAATGIDSKTVGSRLTAMKKTGLVESPVRCKYGVTEEGRAALS
jgi:predicted transcriptional regulator